MLTLLVMAGLLSSLVVLLPSSTSPAGAVETDEIDTGAETYDLFLGHNGFSNAHLADWMSWVKDDVRLEKMTLPASHDSMALHGGDAVQTQGLCGSVSDEGSSPCDIKEQYNAGIRWVDLRLECDVVSGVDTVRLYHGPQFQEATLGDVMDMTKEWLAAHPTETIVFQTARNDGDDRECDLASAVDRVYAQSAYKPIVWQGPNDDVDGKCWDESGNQLNIALKPNTCAAGGVALGRDDLNGDGVLNDLDSESYVDGTNVKYRIPMLKQVRGKIVPLNQTYNGDLDLNERNVVSDNHYKVCVTDGCPIPPGANRNDGDTESQIFILDKNREIEESLVDANQLANYCLPSCINGGQFTLTQAMGSTATLPRWVASGETTAYPGTNVTAFNYLWDSENGLTRAGVVYTDFAGAGLLSVLVAYNLIDLDPAKRGLLQPTFDQLVDHLSPAADDFAAKCGPVSPDCEGPAHNASGLWYNFLTLHAPQLRWANAVTRNADTRIECITVCSFQSENRDGQHDLDWDYRVWDAGDSGPNTSVRTDAQARFAALSDQADGSASLGAQANFVKNGMAATFPGMYWAVTVTDGDTDPDSFFFAFNGLHVSADDGGFHYEGVGMDASRTTSTIVSGDPTPAGGSPQSYVLEVTSEEGRRAPDGPVSFVTRSDAQLNDVPVSSCQNVLPFERTGNKAKYRCDVTFQFDVGNQFLTLKTNFNSGGFFPSPAEYDLQLQPMETPGAITTQPQDATARIGEPVQFFVGVSGNPAPSVQWQVSTDDGSTWVDVPGTVQGAQGQRLFLNPAFDQDGNRYRAQVGNGTGSVTSQVAKLTVSGAPFALSFGPRRLTIVGTGRSTQLEAFGNGAPTPTVQWQFTTSSTPSATDWHDVAGATSTVLTITNADPTLHEGFYRAVFTNSLGSDVSQVGEVQVEDLTSEVATLQMIAGANGTYFANSQGVTGEAEPYHVIVTDLDAQDGRISPTGTVTLSQGTTVGCVADLASSGPGESTGDCTFVPTAGPITALYSGDPVFGTATDSLTHTVSPASTKTEVTTSPSPSFVGQTIHLTATVSAVAPGGGIPEGSVTFKRLATTVCTAVPLVNGVATCDTVGPHTGHTAFTAVYTHSGSGYLDSTGVVGHNIDWSPTKLTLTGPAGPTSVGDPITLHATVEATGGGAGVPQGHVTFTEGPTVLCDEVPLVAGAATCVLPSAPITGGTKTYLASFVDPNVDYQGTTKTLTHTVLKAAPTTSLTSSQNPSIYGSPVTFTVTVTGRPGLPVPSGAVSLLDQVNPLDPEVSLASGALDATGTFTFTASRLPIATQVVRMTYGGDATYSVPASGAQLVQTVDKKPLTITASSTTQAYGSPAPTITASYVGFLDGDDRSDLATQPTCSSPVGVTTPAGTYTSSCSGGDDETYALGYVSGTVTVTKAGSAVNLTVVPSPSTYGQIPVANVKVTGPGGSPTGTVQASVDGTNVGGPVTLVDGKAQVALPGLAAGTRSVKVTYSGDTNHNPKSATVSQLVNKASTTLEAHPALLSLRILPSLALAISASPSATLTENVNGTGVAGKTIVFRANGTEICRAVTDSTGTARCPGVVPLVAVVLGLGYRADFAGDANLLASGDNGDLIRLG